MDQVPYTNRKKTSEDYKDSQHIREGKVGKQEIPV